MTEYKIGDQVTVWGDVPHKITTVASLKPWRKDVIVTLADGSRWSEGRGCRWENRSTSWYTGESICLTEPGDEAAMRRHTDMSMARNFFGWRNLSDERLHTIAEILRAHKAQAGKEPRP